MAIDFTLEPWKRLPKLAPPGTSTEDLTAAAERWSTTTDMYAACADLWEEAAMKIDIMPDVIDEQIPLDNREIRSISQDGISITYASDNLIRDGWTARAATSAKMMDRARYFRKKAKAKSVTVHDPEYNPWKNSGRECDEIIIPVDEV